jgi:drug/metabolite transporter (DMT)-like permease
MLLVVLIWGANFSVTKAVFAYLPPLAFTAVRFTAASVLLMALRRWLEGPSRLSPPLFWRLVVLGVVGNTLYQLGFILGLVRTTASNSALLLASMPTVVALIASVLRLERPTPRVWWGIAIATLGVAGVVAARGFGFSGATMSGDLLTLAAVLCWAAYTLGLRTVPATVSPLEVTTLVTVAGTPLLIAAGMPELLRVRWTEVDPRGWAGLAYATVLSLVVAYLLWNRSVRDVGPSRTVIYMCLTPLVAVATAWLLLGERPVPLQAVGAVLIVWGVLLTRRAPS